MTDTLGYVLTDLFEGTRVILCADCADWIAKSEYALVRIVRDRSEPAGSILFCSECLFTFLSK
jgi:hypothetical protein